MRLKGFTLVELAIVLVIIGIILGGVLKGQELIFNAKVKRLQSQIKEMMTAFYTYYDKYGYYPGDDPTASTRWPGAPNGNGDGRITEYHCNEIPDPSGKEESCYLWRHLRYANLISGDPNEDVPAKLLPRHVFGGYIDIFREQALLGGDNYTATWIALRTLEAQAAKALDSLIDDGKCTKGSVLRAGEANCTGDDYPSSGFVEIWIRF